MIGHACLWPHWARQSPCGYLVWHCLNDLSCIALTSVHIYSWHYVAIIIKIRSIYSWHHHLSIIFIILICIIITNGRINIGRCNMLIIFTNIVHRTCKITIRVIWSICKLYLELHSINSKFDHLTDFYIISTSCTFSNRIANGQNQMQLAF